MFMLQLTTPSYVKVGCLGHPGASTFGGQLLDEELPPQLANASNPAKGPYARETGGTHHTDIAVERGRERGKTPSPKNAQDLKEGPLQNAKKKAC